MKPCWENKEREGAAAVPRWPPLVRRRLTLPAACRWPLRLLADKELAELREKLEEKYRITS